MVDLLGQNFPKPIEVRWLELNTFFIFKSQTFKPQTLCDLLWLPQQHNSKQNRDREEANMLRATATTAAEPGESEVKKRTFQISGDNGTPNETKSGTISVSSHGFSTLVPKSQTYQNPNE